MKLTVSINGGDLLLTLSSCGEDASTFSIPKGKTGIIVSAINRALNSKEFRGEVEVDPYGRVTYHEEVKREII